MPTSLIRTSTLLGLATAVACVALLLTWIGGSDSPSPAGAAAPAAAADDSFSVFDRPATGDDNTAGWRAREGSSTELDFTNARVVFRDSSRAVAAVPSADGPCLVTQFQDGSGGEACGGKGKLTVNAGYNGAIGLAPDSVKSVTVALTDGTKRDLAVEDNVFVSPVDASRVTYELRGNTESIELMPASSVPSGATIDAAGVVSGGKAP